MLGQIEIKRFGCEGIEGLRSLVSCVKTADERGARSFSSAQGRYVNSVMFTVLQFYCQLSPEHLLLVVWWA
jgi:hypothetical protein